MYHSLSWLTLSSKLLEQVVNILSLSFFSGRSLFPKTVLPSCQALPEIAFVCFASDFPVTKLNRLLFEFIQYCISEIQNAVLHSQYLKHCLFFFYLKHIIHFLHSFLTVRHANGQQINKKTLDSITHQKNATKTAVRCYLTPC